MSSILAREWRERDRGDKGNKRDKEGLQVQGSNYQLPTTHYQLSDNC